MKKFLSILLLSLTSFLAAQHGLTGETLIQRANGNKVAIEQLQQADVVTCQDDLAQESSKVGRVTAIQKQVLTHYFILSYINNDTQQTIVIAPEQQLFDAVRQTFLTAQEINNLIRNHQEVVIASNIGKAVHVAAISNCVEINDPTKALPFYAITVDDCHTFQIGAQGFVAHNFGFLVGLLFGGGGVALETIAVNVFGMAATYTAGKIFEQHRNVPDRYFEHGSVVYSNPNPPTPPTSSTPPNNNNNNNGDPQKPNGNGNGGNGLKPEDGIGFASLLKDRDKKSSEDAFFENNRQHIFRDTPGHVSDTSENRQMLQDLVSNEKNWVGKDQHGNKWYAKDMPDGTQQWAWTRDGKIRDGGLNEFKLEWDPNTGFCNPKRPGK